MARDRKQAKLKQRMHRKEKAEDTRRAGAMPEETESALQELARMFAKDSAQLGEHHFYITAASVRWPHGSSQRSR